MQMKFWAAVKYISKGEQNGIRADRTYHNRDFVCHPHNRARCSNNHTGYSGSICIKEQNRSSVNIKMDPNNPAVRLCVEGTQAEFQGQIDQALTCYERV